MMHALHLYLGGLKEVAVVGKKNDPSTQAMLDFMRRKFCPNAVIAFAYEEEVQEHTQTVPLLAGRKTVSGKAAAYVCRLGTCLAPVTSPKELQKLLSYEE